jgi:hypothetical protein
MIFISLLSVFGMGMKAQAQEYISIYANIPLAPNKVLTIDAQSATAPASNYVWIDGHWNWNGRYREYDWTRGHWEIAPYENAYWIPGYWENYKSGYKWIDAGWVSQSKRFTFGYSDERFDYYGRPVYYHQPLNSNLYGYAYGYDHNPNHIGEGYNSSPDFNGFPKKERDQINKVNNPGYVQTTNHRSATEVRSISGNSSLTSSVQITKNTMGENVMAMVGNK